MLQASRVTLLASLLPVAAALPGSGARQEPSPAPKAALGEVVPDHTFRPFLAGGDGRQKLSEFRGQPVLIVNWTDTDFGRGSAQEAEKLADELVPAGLVLILLDTHQKDEKAIEASVMRLYPASPARLTTNQKLPIAYLENGPPPDVALIGVDGTLLVAGSYTVDLNKASKLIKSELKRQRSGWGESDAARAARALAFGEGRLAAALSALESAREAPSAAELEAVEREIAARWDARVRAVSWWMERGEALRALEGARALAADARGKADWEAAAAELLRRFEDGPHARELELDRKLASLLEPLERKATERDAEKLRKFAAEAGDSAVGKRALHLAEIAALAAGK